MNRPSCIGLSPSFIYNIKLTTTKIINDLLAFTYLLVGWLTLCSWLTVLPKYQIRTRHSQILKIKCDWDIPSSKFQKYWFYFVKTNQTSNCWGMKHIWQWMSGNSCWSWYIIFPLKARNATISACDSVRPEEGVWLSASVPPGPSGLGLRMGSDRRAHGWRGTCPNAEGV